MQTDENLLLALKIETETKMDRSRFQAFIFVSWPAALISFLDQSTSQCCSSNMALDNPIISARSHRDCYKQLRQPLGGGTRDPTQEIGLSDQMRHRRYQSLHETYLPVVIASTRNMVWDVVVGHNLLVWMTVWTRQQFKPSVKKPTITPCTCTFRSSFVHSIT